MKPIKFDLPIDGVNVKNLDELRSHFTIEILDHYRNGSLLKWLQTRDLEEQISALLQIAGNQVTFKELSDIFAVNLTISQDRPSLSKSPSSSGVSQGMEHFAALFEESLKCADMRAGEIISAEVVRIERSFVALNAGIDRTCYVRIDEFLDDNDVIEVQVGDYVSVAIDALLDEYGNTILSHEDLVRMNGWLALESALESGDYVNGTVSGAGKDGLNVLVNGFTAQVPTFLVDIYSRNNMNQFAGRTLEFKVITLDRKNNLVILSPRTAIE